MNKDEVLNNCLTFLRGERDCYFQSIIGPDGEVADPADLDHLYDIEGLIEQVQKAAK